MTVGIPDSLLALRSRFRTRDALEHIAGARPPRGTRQAAVLILLCGPASDFEVVFIEKTRELRSHAGQVAFPGGALEESDADAIAAALREANEEVGLDPDQIVVLGALPTAHIVRSGFDVTSVVGWWPHPEDLVPVDLHEVAAVHRIAVANLLDPAARLTWVHPSGLVGPAFVIEDLFIWGFTAYLLDGLFELAGWTIPWDASRTSEIPSRFLSERL